MKFKQINVIAISNRRARTNYADAMPNSQEHKERVMKKIAVVSLALAVLTAAPALARTGRHHQDQSWTSSQTNPGYYDPARVRSGDIPFAPF
jgi:hypothetical protein